MVTPEQFRDRIEGFLSRSEITPTQFGIDAVRDPNFVRDIRNGRVPSLKTAAQVLDFIDTRSAPAPSSETREVA